MFKIDINFLLRRTERFVLSFVPITKRYHPGCYQNGSLYDLSLSYVSQFRRWDDVVDMVSRLRYERMRKTGRFMAEGR